MSDLAALVVRLQADNSQYIKALDQSTQKLNKFSSDQGKLLTDIAGKFAAAFTIDKIVDFSAASIEAAASLSKLSAASGVSVEALSGLSAAFAAVGLTQDDLGTSLKKLNSAISEAAGDSTSKAGIAFKLLGVNVKDANGNIKDAATVNAEVADAFSHTADGANKVAIAIALFGRAGQNMIPILDKGSAGIDQLRQDAEAMGAVLGKDAADAAEAFQQKLNALQSNVKAGLGNAITANLVPALLAMADAFGSAADKGEALQSLGSGIASVFKVAIVIGLEVARTFENIGDGIGSLAAQAVALAHGRFSEVNSIIADNGAQTEARNKKFAAAEAALFNDTAQAQVLAAQKGAAGAADAQKSGQLGSLEGGVKSAAADKELSSFDSGLKDQVQSFGLGEAALVKYKLQFGPLADALKIAGDAGKQYAADALKQAAALQNLKDTKTVGDEAAKIQQQTAALDQSDVAAFKLKVTTGDLGKALDRLGPSAAQSRQHLIDLNNALIDAKDNKAIQGISDQLDVLNGKLVVAAGHAFDLAHQSLTQNLQARSGAGDQQATDQLKQVDALRQATVAEAAFAEQEQKRAIIEQQLATQTANINAARAAGAITDLQQSAQIDDAQKTEIANLQAVYAAEKQIADDSGLPKLTQQTQAFANQITGLKSNTDQLTKSINQGLENSATDVFDKFISGSESAKNAVLDFLKDIEKQFIHLISQNFAQQLFGAGGAGSGAAGGISSLLGFATGSGGGSSGSGGGGFLSGLASLFGKGGGGSGAPVAAQITDLNAAELAGFAGGGQIDPGQLAVVGEKGPELAYGGARGLQVIPNNKMGGVSVTNHFTVQSSNGTISRQSQNQTAALAARSLQIASARNNR